MRWKLLPYLAILVFSIIVGVIRVFLILEWNWKEHLIVFVCQVIFLSMTWLIIRSVSMYLDKKIPFEKHVVRRISIQIIVAILLNFPLFALLLMNADKLHLPFFNRQFLAVLSILFFVFIVFLSIGYNAFYFFKEWQKSVALQAQLKVEAAELKMDKSMMQYHHLKNQVNPHFLFNTFTSLDGLIHSNPDLASKFIWHLSKVYRYVLEHKENEIVSLQTEVDFIRHYISLLDLRHKNILHIEVDIRPSSLEKGIVMVTLQMLLDNAIKHNSLNEENPLYISIRDEGSFLEVSNNKQLRKQIETSNGHGLQQLKDLYGFLTPEQVIIIDNADRFTIKLPLL